MVFEQRRQRVLLFFGVVVLACSPVAAKPSTPVPLEPYLEAELGRLEETYRLLDRFAAEIWPQWDNFHEIEVRVRFPNEVRLLVNPRAAVDSGYERLQGRDVHAKPVYINRDEEQPGETELPLVVGRGRGGLIIRIDLRPLAMDGEQADRVSFVRNQLERSSDEDAEFSIEPAGDSDSHILMLVHEHFHGLQTQHGPRQGSVEGLQQYEVNAEYATYSEIEGLALMKAYRQERRREALEYLKDYLVARQRKHERMPPEARRGEPYFALVEGLPTYVSLKMAALIEQAGYESELSSETDPYFFHFDYVRGYFESLMDEGMRFAAQWTLDKRGKYYLYGAYQCFLLDRFAPGWKQDFFEKKRNLDDLTAELLAMSPEEEAAVAGRLVSRYPYEALLAKHASAIAEH